MGNKDKPLLAVTLGDITGIGDIVVTVDMPKQTKKDVEDDDWPRIPDMCKVVDRRTTYLHADVLRIDGDEILFLACQRVVEPQRYHRASSSSPSAPRSGTLPLALTKQHA